LRRDDDARAAHAEGFGKRIDDPDSVVLNCPRGGLSRAFYTL
jgi:hypothetical protein